MDGFLGTNLIGRTDVGLHYAHLQLAMFASFLCFSTYSRSQFSLVNTVHTTHDLSSPLPAEQPHTLKELGHLAHDAPGPASLFLSSSFLRRPSTPWAVSVRVCVWCVQMDGWKHMYTYLSLSGYSILSPARHALTSQEKIQPCHRCVYDVDRPTNLTNRAEGKTGRPRPIKRERKSPVFTSFQQSQPGQQPVLMLDTHTLHCGGGTTVV